MADSLKQRLDEDIKTAMRAKDKERLGTLRMIHAAVRQVEIDERTELDDLGVVKVMDKMIKQRRDAMKQYQEAGRDDLAAKEEAELNIIQEYMPGALTEDELDGLIRQAISKTDANDARDLGKVIAALRGQVTGRADMTHVRDKVLEALPPQVE